jgi:hypothetical protein
MMRKHEKACRKVNANLAALLIERQPLSAETQAHFAACVDCASELASMESTMRLLDEWKAPDPGAFFDARLTQRLRLEKAQAPAGFLERLRARVLYSTNMRVRPWATAATAAMLAIGAGTIAVLKHQTPPVETSAAVYDLQYYDGNAQIIQQLGALDSDDEDSTDAPR